MKRLVLPALLSLFTVGITFGQNAVIDKAMQEEVKKAKEKSDKDIANEKTSGKAKTWFDRGKAYEEVAVRYAALDSNAALTAYEAFKKAAELGTSSDTKGAKVAKEAQDILTGSTASNLYVALLQQGVGKYQNKNMRGALAFFQAASNVNPKDTSSSSATMLTGIAAQQLDDQKLAREAFEKYIVAGGKDPAIFYAVANAYKTEKNFDKAVEFLDKGIAANPTNKDLKSEKVNIFLASGRADDAIKHLQEMVTAEPTNVQNLFNLGILYDNNATLSGDELRKLNDQLKKGNQLKTKIAEQKDKLSVYTAEKAKLQTNIKKQPKNPEFKRQLTEVTQKEKEFQTTLDQLNQDLKSYETSQQGVNTADVQAKIDALTAKQNEQKGLAQESYKKVLKIEPTNYDANYSMGVVFFNEAVETKKKVDAMDMQTYQKEGKAVEQEVVVKFKQAMPYFEKALETKPEQEVKDNLKNLYNILKQFEKTDAYDEKLKKVSE